MALTKKYQVRNGLRACIRNEEGVKDACEDCPFEGKEKCRRKLLVLTQWLMENTVDAYPPEVIGNFYDEKYFCGQCEAPIKRAYKCCPQCGYDIDWVTEGVGAQKDCDDSVEFDDEED